MAAWRFALLSICLMQALAFSQADHERRLLQAPAPAPVIAPTPKAPQPPGACLGDFSFNVLPQNQVQTLVASCNVAGTATASKDCCENIQFLGLALLALNSQSNSNIYAITSDTPTGQNIACVNDFKNQILTPNNVNIPSDVNTFCASYNVEVFPNIETTLQGTACPIRDAATVGTNVDLNALAGVCYGPNSCVLDQSGLTQCEDAVVVGAKQLAGTGANTNTITACAEVVSARLVQTHFYESYYSLIQDCGNSTSVNALPPVLEFAQSPTNTFSLPPLPPRPPTPAPAPSPNKQSPGPAPGPAPVPGPHPGPAPGPSSIPPPPPAVPSPPPPPGAAASTSANLGLLVGIVLLIASIL